MELREFLKPFIKNISLIVLTALVFGVVAYLVSLRMPDKYQATLTLYIRQLSAQAQEPTGDSKDYYTYDGYYAHKAAQEYTDTVLGFLESPDILQRAGEIVWTEVSQDQQQKLQKAVYSEKVAPQLIKLTVTFDNYNKASQLVNGITQAVKEKADSLAQTDTSDSSLIIEALSSTPLVKTLQPQRWLNTLVAVAAGIIFSCVVVWVKEYF